VATEAKTAMEAMVKLFILKVVVWVSYGRARVGGVCITTVELIDLRCRGGYPKLFISNRAARHAML
jgi:hypothetical protein